MKIKNSIPNFITCCNLFSGCVATVMALTGKIELAALWIILAAVFDFCDGFAARFLKAYSPMGKELDSLADVISFGMAPGMILFWILKEATLYQPFGTISPFIPYLAFVIPVFSGLRLAKFNVDDRQTTSFIGLPVPANALFWASIGYSLCSTAEALSIGFIIGIILLSFLSSWLLVSEIPMFSLKVKSLKWRGNEKRYILILGSILFIALFKLLGVAGAILLYVALSFFNKRK